MMQVALVMGGRVVFSVQAPTLAAAEAIIAESGRTGTPIEMPLGISGLTHWRDGEEWAERPTLPEPPALTAGVAADWALPEGAVVTVDPLNGAAPVSETVAGVFSIGLAAGEWRVSVNPPFPFRAAGWRIEVAS